MKKAIYLRQEWTGHLFKIACASSKVQHLAVHSQHLSFLPDTSNIAPPRLGVSNLSFC